MTVFMLYSRTQSQQHDFREALQVVTSNDLKIQNTQEIKRTIFNRTKQARISNVLARFVQFRSN